MKNIPTQVGFQYENKWLKLSEIQTETNETNFILKKIKTTFISSQESWKKEQAILEMLNHLSIIKPAVEENTSSSTNKKYVLPRGVPLDQVIKEDQLTLVEKLKIANDLIEIMLSFHGKNLFFCDFNWQIFWYDLLEEQIYLLDALMTIHASSIPEYYNANLDIEANMFCTSPEQSLQTASIPDLRSNYYSLGTILYYLFTTKKPYDGNERISVLHKHLSLSPVSPYEYRKDIGLPLSKFILKLLAKNPEDRYQSPEGLKWDFEQIKEHLRKSEGKQKQDFELGTHDFPLQFTLPDRLFFRKQEHDLLFQQAQYVQDGNKVLVSLYGASNVGIEYVMEDFIRNIDFEDFYIGKGKYTKDDNLPYQGIRKITSDLLTQINLQDSDTQIKRDLNAVLGSLSGVMIAFHKEFQSLFISNETVQELTGTAALNRFVYAYMEFLSVLEGQGKAVVLCLDDLHLADYGSLRLIEQLLKTSVLRSVMIVIGFDQQRDHWSSHFQDFFNRMKNAFDTRENVRMLETEMKNFSEEDLEKMLLKLKIEPIEHFKTILYDKTKGNIAFIKQFFGELTTHQLIKARIAEQKWQVNIEAVKDIQLSSDIENFLLDRVQHVEEQELTVLKVAATIGQQFKISQLYHMVQFDPVLTREIIDRLRSKDFFIPLRYKQAKLHELQFTHPSFLPIINKLTTPTEYETIKLQLANDIAHHMGEADNDIRLYELMNHLLPISAEKCQDYKTHIQSAAFKAKKETAFETARKYFEKLVQIEDSSPEKNTKIIFEHTYEACECALFAMNYNRYEHLLQKLPTLAANDHQRYGVYQLKASAYMQLEQFQEVIDNMIAGLKDMGIRFSSKINTFDQIVIFSKNVWRTRKISPDTIEQFHFNQEELPKIYHRLMYTSSAALYFLNPPLTSRITQIGITNILKKGLSLSSPNDLVSAGFSMNGFSNLVGQANRVALAGLKLLNHKIVDNNVELASYFMYATFVQHTSQPLSVCTNLLEKYYKKGREIGNVYTAFYCLGINRWYMLFDGTPLGEMKEALEASHLLAIDVNQTTTDNYHKMMKSLVIELQRGHFDEEVLTDSTLPIHSVDLETADHTVKIGIQSLELILQAAKGVVIQDVKFLSSIISRIATLGHGTYNSIVQIYYTLYHALKNESNTRILSKKVLKKYLKVLEVRAKSAPFNYAAKYYLLKALQADQQQKKVTAFSNYQKADHAAMEYDNLWDRGMVLEEYARFLLKKGQQNMGLDKMEAAITAYNIWGATSIVNRLYQEFPSLRVQGREEQKVNAAEKLEGKELRKIFEWSKKILKEQELDLQIKTLFQAIEDIVPTKRIVFLVNMEDTLKMYCEKQSGKEASFPDKNAESTHLPLSLLSLVMRRKNTLVLEDATQDKQFANDLYLQSKRIKSILCLPFVKNKEVKNLLYLEGNTIKNTFQQKKIDLIEALYTQVSTSLDHAVLTEMLEEKLELRSRQIQIERDKSDELLRNILPLTIAKELKEKGKVKARKYENVSVLFTDFKDFSQYSTMLSADQIIGELDDCYRAFDRIVEEYDLEKIKTIGDSYMCAAGIPEPKQDHELDIVKAGLAMITYIKISNERRIQNGLPPMSIRAGIHTGPVIAGVVGFKKYAYDIWGPTVNIASRMESSSETGRLNISGSTYLKVKNHYDCTYRGKIDAKNVGEVDMYFVEQ